MGTFAYIDFARKMANDVGAWCGFEKTCRFGSLTAPPKNSGYCRND